MKKPLILSPAGSIESLYAAVNAGADEVYFGLPEFNARYNAKNFTDEDLKQALKMCRILGVKTNITVNTLITDKEMPRALDMVYNAACLGADAFIVQDLGFASRIKAEMPSLVLHASTQCACHNAEGAAMLTSLGFDRVVLAREMPKDEIKKVTELGIETEIFVHGALCVCQSGMCLMSSVIGGRSGNRGLCAQPCRLPYTMHNNKNGYPLSLKDLSLAKKVEDIMDLGVTSLKIEGRMKSPEYVYGTTKIWRELIDGGKNAGKREMEELESIFSREGFTDKYFSGLYTKDNRDMYGIRSKEDKENTRDIEKKLNVSENTQKKHIDISCFIKEQGNAVLTAFCGDVTASITSDFICPSATGKPLTKDEVKASLSKLGTTFFEAEGDAVTVEISGNVFLSKSMLNSLRRTLVEALENELCGDVEIKREQSVMTSSRRQKVQKQTTLICCKTWEIAKHSFADYISIPLSQIDFADVLQDGKNFGVTLPRVIYSSEMDALKEKLEKAKAKGFSFILVSNIGQVKAAKDSGLTMFSDIGMNVFNSSTISVLENMVFSLITVSPELNEAQIRDLSKSDDTLLCAFVKGRLPVMVLESCIVKAGGKCSDCDGTPCDILHDRIGKDFPVFGEKRLIGNGTPCRNIIYNAVETDLLSKKEKTDKMNVDTVMIYRL